MILNSIGVPFSHQLQVFVFFVDLSSSAYDLFHLHCVCPVGFALKYQKVEELRVALGFFRSDVPLGVLLAALGKLERLSHSVDLANTIVMISSVVIMPETVLVLG